MNLEDLGEPIAEGRTAEVYAHGEDAVLKLLRPDFADDMIDIEAAKTTAAHAAGAPAPAVRELVDADGRRGIVFDRIDGDELLYEAVHEPFRMTTWGKMLARAHVDVLTKSTQDLPTIKEVWGAKIEVADLTEHQRTAALNVLSAAPDDDALLHGDVHPGNVFLTSDGSMLIDWIDAARGHPGADVARTMWLMSAATVSPDLVNRRIVLAFQGVFRRSYAKLVSRSLGLNRRVIDAWRLPMAAARLAEGVEHEEPALRAEVVKLTGG